MFNNMKIGLRLALGFCLVISFMIAIIVLSLISMQVNHDNLDRIVKEVNVRVRLANNMVDNAREVALSVRGILLLKHSNASREQIQKMKENWTENWEKYDQNRAAIKKLMVQECVVGHQLFANIESSADIARKQTKKAMEMALAGEVKEATAFVFSTAFPSVRLWIKNSQDFILHSEEHTATFYTAAHAGQESRRTAMFILGALAIALAIAMAIFLTLSITRPLKVSVQTANMIAAKDLTVDLSTYRKRGDEVGAMTQAFREMVESLRRTIADIADGIALLGSSTSEILASTTQVASGTAESATAINETTTTVEEVRQASQLSSEKAKNVSDKSQRVAQVSQSGQKAVAETVSGIENIRKQMESIAQTIVRLSEQSQSIGGIIASVTDIADQSNLLSVNAAIEASRAGEQGKGFTVVAQEIKLLAEQSKQATTQVRDILNDVQKATSAAVMATEQGSKAVEVCVKQSVQAGEAIKILAESSAEAAQTATQIVASSQQQVVGMDQIGTAMQNINQAGAQTAASMRQVEVAAQNLNELGQKLKGMVEQFKR